MKIKLDNYTGNASSLQVSFDGGETYTKTIAVNNSDNTLLFDPNNDNCVSLDDIKIKGDKTEITPEFNSNLELSLINKILYPDVSYTWIDLAEYPAFVEALIKNAGDNNINSNYSHDNPTIKSWQFYDWEYWDDKVFDGYVPLNRSLWISHQMSYTDDYPIIRNGEYYKFNFNNLLEEQKEPAAIGLLCFLNNLFHADRSSYSVEILPDYQRAYDSGASYITVDLSTFPDITWENIPGCLEDSCNRQFSDTLNTIHPLFGRSLSKFYYMSCINSYTNEMPLPLYIPKGYNFPEDLVIDSSSYNTHLDVYIHEEDVDNLFNKIRGINYESGLYHNIKINIIPAKEGTTHYLEHELLDCPNIDIKTLRKIRASTGKYYIGQTSEYYDSENSSNNDISDYI